jgi:cobalt-precorrin 5A hydrolase
VIVAGLGCRRGTGASALLAALDAALAACGRGRGEIALVAAPEVKRDETGVAEAAQALGVGVRFVGVPEMESVESAAAVQPPLHPGERDGVRGAPQAHTHGLTPSAAAAKHLGLPVSPAEAAALAAAGPGARLLGPRTVAGPAVCALAEALP